jgi:hypothetical protein
MDAERALAALASKKEHSRIVHEQAIKGFCLPYLQPKVDTVYKRGAPWNPLQYDPHVVRPLSQIVAQSVMRYQMAHCVDKSSR